MSDLAATGTCRHCGQPIHYSTGYSGWVHDTLPPTRVCQVEGSKTLAEPKRVKAK